MWDIATPFVERYRTEFELVDGRLVRFYHQPFSADDQTKIRDILCKLEAQTVKRVNPLCNHFENLFSLWKPPNDTTIFDELKEKLLAAMIAGTLEEIVGSSERDTKKTFR